MKLLKGKRLNPVFARREISRDPIPTRTGVRSVALVVARDASALGGACAVHFCARVGQRGFAPLTDRCRRGSSRRASGCVVECLRRRAASLAELRKVESSASAGQACVWRASVCGTAWLCRAPACVTSARASQPLDEDADKMALTDPSCNTDQGV